LKVCVHSPVQEYGYDQRPYDRPVQPVLACIADRYASSGGAHLISFSMTIRKGLPSVGLIASVDPCRSPAAGIGCRLREIRASILTRPTLERLRPGNID